MAASMSDEKPGAWCCELPRLAVLAVSGSDAGKLLQGQCTCDILALPEGREQLGAFCNAKGRVIATFRVFQQAGVYYLLLSRDLADDMERRLRRVVLRAAVSIENVSETWRISGAGGARNDLSAGLGLEQVPGLGEVAEWAGGYAVGVEGQRLLLLSPADSDSGALTPLMETQVSDPWELAEVRAGLAVLSSATREEFIPQMLNLDLLQAISFKKGCYIGQEIVARTHYLGKPKRRMFRLGAGRALLAAGAAVYQCGRPEQGVGSVVQVANNETGEQEMLAVLALDALEGGGRLCGAGPEGPELNVLALPYPVL